MLDTLIFVNEVAVMLILLILIYTSFRVVKVLEGFLAAYNRHIDVIKSTERKILSVDNMSRPSYDTPLAPTKPSMKVEDLAPDMIAPALKKPPKPPGGFGSKVNG
jgi:hypothetical protein